MYNFRRLSDEFIMDFVKFNFHILLPRIGYFFVE